MTDIDRDKLRAWLDNKISHQNEVIAERKAADPEDDVAIRMEGANAFTHLLNLEISSGRLDVESWPKEQRKPRPTPLARRDDPHTSWRAAWMQTKGDQQLLYRAIYMVLTQKPCTDDQLVRIIQHNITTATPSGIRSRRAELVDTGWVKDSGERRDSDAGSPMTVWEAVPEKEN